MPTLSELETLLSDRVGANLSFTTELNLVRARLLQGGNWKGSKDQIVLTVYSDVDGNSIVTLPFGYETILAGAVRSENVLCAGLPLGVRNGYAEFADTGLGYGGLTSDFQEVNGRFAVFQEWEGQMYIRLKFEATESSGVIHLKGRFEDEEVYSLYSGSWIPGEKIAFSGTTTVTSTKKFDALGFSAVKPVTNGRVSVYCVDDDDVETLVGVWEPTETIPRRKRYKVPTCEDVSATESTSEITTLAPSQVYTKTEIDAMFSGTGTITVNSTGTTDLVYAAYFLRRIRIIAQAGAGAYTHKFLLDNSVIKDGSVLRIALEIAASANPTLKFYDNVATTEDTLRVTFAGDSSNAQYMTLVFTYDAVAARWNYDGREI